MSLTQADPQEREAEFRDFLDAHLDRAFRLAYRMLAGERAAAEDVVQDACLRAHRALSSFRGEASLRTWFDRILVREVQRYRRWAAVRRLWSTKDFDETSEAGVAPHRDTGDPALRAQIQRALAALTERQREVFVLVHLEGYSVREAAEILDKPTGTLKSHLHRALLRLRKELKGLQQELDGLTTKEKQAEEPAALASSKNLETSHVG